MINDITNSSVTSSSLDFYFNNLITTISEVIEKHTPLHTASRKQKRIQNKPWLTKGFLTSIKNKQLLYKNFFLGNNEFGKLYYKKYADKLTRVKNLTKKIYYNEAINDKKNNPKELWRFINSVIPSKRSSPFPTVPKLAPPGPPNRGGARTKRGPRKSSVRSTIYSTYDKGALNRPILRFNIFFVLTHAMWGSHTIFILLTIGAPANFSKSSSRKTSKQTFSSIPRAPHPQEKGAKISL